MNNSTTTAGNVEQQNLSQSILVSQDVPVLGSKFNYFIGAGTERKLVTFDNAKANIVAEGTAIEPTDATFARVEFKQKRVGDAFTITQNADNDIQTSVVAQLKQTLIKRILKTVAAQAFGYGNKDGAELQFQSILDYNSQTANLVNGLKIQEYTGGATLTNVDNAFGAFFQDNAGEAICVVDSFASANTLVDGSGAKLLKHENRANGSIGTIYGVHVHVLDMNSKAKMVIMNPKAYGVSIAKDTDFREPADTMNGKITIVADLYAQGKVIDPNAIKIIKA